MPGLTSSSHTPRRQQPSHEPSALSPEPLSGLPDSGAECIHGFVKPGFEAVREAFAANLYSGADIGASAAVFVHGEAVVDLWGGYFDATYTRPWGEDTIVNGFSSTKTMTALCALMLADRGEIELDAPVKKYWPEFAAAGKGRVEVRHIVSHTSGVAGWAEPMTLQDIYDPEKSTVLLARQEPWWEPGTGAGYHGMNMGHLVGEVVRRVTGMSLGKFFQKEIATPLRADYHIGTPVECDPRISLLIQGYPIQPNGNEFFKRSLLNPAARHFDTWSIAWRRAELGAMNGHGNARAIAMIQSILANGGVKGTRLLSEQGRLRVLAEQANGVDLVLGVPLRWGMGYCLNLPVPRGQLDPSRALGRNVAFWAGNGGSMSYVDLDARMAFGFTPNRWITGPHEQQRSLRILSAAYACLTRLPANS
ncbi:MAG TPA: serine hydrolase domain-containing protein [Steroidobacteraceae bacterium]